MKYVAFVFLHCITVVQGRNRCDKRNCEYSTDLKKK